MSSILNNKLVLVIVAILIAVGLWFGLSQSSTPASSSAIRTTSTSGEITDGSVQSTGAESNTIVEVLLALRTVKLDGVIFSEPVFRNLKDFSATIVPEPVGRQDPFAPNTSMAAAPDTSHTVQLFKSQSGIKARRR